MKTNVKKVLEIPARSRKRKTGPQRDPACKTFLLIINLWIFRYEYSKEQYPSK
ncbi:hypothetical protein [Galbibacter sp. PAP.153]|uniref:hypothetical protein n=1 Tax=Galbibacter sp. PAP.153 TaxID=3104623 RepID=UPI00300AA38F